MRRHEFLREVHRRLEPRNYLEIGVNDGRSLALSRVPSIAIDPAFKVTVPIRCDVDLVKATSDDFFRRKNPLRHLRSGRNPIRNIRRGRPLFARYTGGNPLDLAFIDGMHLFEFALRDFINVERYARSTSVIVFDDMLPRNVDEAARDRHTREWTGDVYKLLPVLATLRPDLVVIPVDTEPTGVLVVLGANHRDRQLRQRYAEIVRRWVVPDPQIVPDAIVRREGAVDPVALLASPLWDDLRRARRLHLPSGRTNERIRERTAELQPPLGLGDRVAAAISRERPAEARPPEPGGAAAGRPSS